VKKTQAQAVLTQLKESGLLAKNYRVDRTKTDVYLPLVPRKHHALLEQYPVVQHAFPQTPKLPSFREKVEGLLTPTELAELNTAMDVVGDIAIIEIPTTLVKKEILIANALLASQLSIHTVVKKIGGHEGVYRLQQYQYLAGKNTKETLHKENGLTFHLDIEKTYFSPRLSHERLRIAKLVAKNENVLVLFSGIAVYPLVIAKHSHARTITAIEINPDACAYAAENIKKNNITNVISTCGDVDAIVPTLGKVFDRVLMPLPKDAPLYLPLVLTVSHPETIIHLYVFLPEEQIELYGRALAEQYPSFRVIKTVKCGQTKPRQYRVCFDLQVK